MFVVSRDNPSFTIILCFYCLSLVVSLARFIHFIDLFKEPISGFVDFLYCITVLSFISTLTLFPFFGLRWDYFALLLVS